MGVSRILNRPGYTRYFPSMGVPAQSGWRQAMGAAIDQGETGSPSIIVFELQGILFHPRGIGEHFSDTVFYQ
jgi:hypothetical protein